MSDRSSIPAKTPGMVRSSIRGRAIFSDCKLEANGLPRHISLTHVKLQAHEPLRVGTPCSLRLEFPDGADSLVIELAVIESFDSQHLRFRSVILRHTNRQNLGSHYGQAVTMMIRPSVMPAPVPDIRASPKVRT